MSAQTCVQALSVQLTCQPSKDTSAIMYRLGRLLLTNAEECEEEDIASVIGLQLHGISRFCGPPETVMRTLYSRVWAVPGMPQLLLRWPLLSHTRLKTQAKQSGNESSPVDFMEELMMHDDTGAEEFAYLIFPLLLRCAFAEDGHPLPPCSSQDCYGLKLRKNLPWGEAATQRALSLFLDEDVRADCCQALRAGPSAICAYLTDHENDEERQPLTAALLACGLGDVCLEQMEGSLTGGTFCRAVLGHIRPAEWKALAHMASECSSALVSGAGPGKAAAGGAQRGQFNLLAGAMLHTALRAIRYFVRHEGSSERLPEVWCKGDTELLAGVLWGCVSVGEKVNRPLLALALDRAQWKEALQTLPAQSPRFSVDGKWRVEDWEMPVEDRALLFHVMTNDVAARVEGKGIKSAGILLQIAAQFARRGRRHAVVQRACKGFMSEEEWNEYAAECGVQGAVPVSPEEGSADRVMEEEEEEEVQEAEEEKQVDGEEAVSNAISLLRRHGIYNIEEREPERGWSILMQTVMQTEGVDKVQVLLDARADPNRSDKSGRTALMYAVVFDKVEVVRALLAANAAVHAQAAEGIRTALSCAAKQNCVAVAEVLIAAGADVNMRSKDDEGEDETALGVGVVSGAEACVRMLLEKSADPNMLCFGKQPVRLCVHEELDSATRHRMLELLFLHGAAAPRKALREFAIYDDPVAIGLCLKAGAEVDARDKDGDTPLSAAVRMGALSVIAPLVAARADVNQKDQILGETLLMEAVDRFGGTPALISKLIEHGAGVNAKHAEWGYTPLQQAVKHPATVKVLLDAGAEVDEGDEEEETALMKAAKEGVAESITLLLQYGADVNLHSYMQERTAVLFAADNGHTAAVKALVDGKADLEICEADDSYSPLDIAVSKGHLDAVRMLLRCKACVNPPPEDFRSPLWVAAAAGQAQAAGILLQAKALVDYQDEDGVSPLMHAAYKGNGEVVRVLLAARADPSLRERTYDKERREDSYRCGSGADALEIAETEGHADIVRLLRNASTASNQVAGGAFNPGRAVTASDCGSPGLPAHTSPNVPTVSSDSGLNGTSTLSPLAAFNLKFGGGPQRTFSFGTGSIPSPGTASGPGSNGSTGPGSIFKFGGPQSPNQVPGNLNLNAGASLGMFTGLGGASGGVSPGASEGFCFGKSASVSFGVSPGASPSPGPGVSAGPPDSGFAFQAPSPGGSTGSGSQAGTGFGSGAVGGAPFVFGK